MNRIKLCIVLLIAIISSFFVVKGIYGIFIKITPPEVNKLTVSQKTSYTVVHQLMDLDGVSYTEYSRTNYTDIPIGTTVTPPVLNLEGFDSPQPSSFTLNSYTNTIITYSYPRKQYTLTINNAGYVTTATPSGTYYYGQEIHLVAAAFDTNNNAFIKWSNDTTNPDYTFTITDNVVIEPIYAISYVITYEPNNGGSQIIAYIPQGQSLGFVPTVTNDDCVGTTGDYHTRQCTYVYEFKGWYKESTFVNQVNEGFVPTSDMTIYAKWNKVYFENAGPVTCDGSNYIDSGVVLFNQLNADKDFIIKFTVDQNNGYSGDRGTIFADMDETGEPFPGVHFFYDNKYTMNVNTLGNKQKKNNTGYVVGQSIIIKKELGKVYYSYNGGNDVQINDFSNFSTYFDNTATFCAGTNSQGNKYRFFKGILSGMSIEIIEPLSYTIHFDANGGTGMMIDQEVMVGKNATLNANQFTHANASFGGWNTAADGTGTSYPNNYAITSDLGNDGDVITLYAQWIPEEHYYVHFDANGGTGTMSNQQFTISAPATPLTANAFTRTNYEYRGWNTAADGSGTHYDDTEAVRDLSLVDEDVVTLYAEWWKIQYNHQGNAVFDGTSATFIDTGVNVFSSANINKDFEIRFTFISVDSDILSVSPTQPTLFNVKDESNNKYPGFNVRINGNINTLNATYRWGGSTQNAPANGISTTPAPIEFVYKRTNGVITIQYSYSGFTSPVYTMITQSSWNLNKPFSTNVAFGGYFDSNNQPGRFFKGTLADMIILMDD